MLTKIVGHWDATNWDIILNSSSLIIGTAVTSGLGFLYWWVVARSFSPNVVGFASAAISAMLLLGSAGGGLGVGTLLVGELRRQPSKAGELITTASLVVASASGALSIIFVLIMPYLSPDLNTIVDSPVTTMLFGLGVIFSAVASILDPALIGLMRGGIQLWRNIVFATAKLVILIVIVRLLNGDGMLIYATWVAGNLISFAYLMWVAARKGTPLLYVPRMDILRKVGRSALEHHALNLAIIGPGYILPIIVTISLSATANARFYIAWLITSFITTIPGSLTMLLYAVGAADQALLSSKICFTLQLSVLSCVLSYGVLLIGGDFVLHIFGNSYVEQAGWSLRILALAAFPWIIKTHYVAICRVLDISAERLFF